MQQERRYSVGTWDTDLQAYTPQIGLTIHPINVRLGELRTILKELRWMGYSCHRFRDEDGEHEDNDWMVLVERTEGQTEEEILKQWER